MSQNDGKKEKTKPLPAAVVESIRRGLDQKARIALIVYHADGAEMVMLPPDLPVVVGRDAPSTVRIPDQTLSRQHARFTLLDGKVTVEDLASTNGTWIAGQRIETAEVKLGDELVLGSVLASVQAIGPSENNLGLESEERFRMRLDDEVVRAHHFRTRFAVLMVRAVSGSGAPRSSSAPRSTSEPGLPSFPETHVARWSTSVRTALRPVDRTALYSHDALLIVVPDASREIALDLARAITLRRRVEEPALLVGGAIYPDSATAAEKLIELSREALASASAEDPVQIASTSPWVAGEARQTGRPGPAGTEEAIVAGPVMRELLETVRRLAAVKIPVILQGETGVGKEVLARLIHDGGPRKSKPMVAVNCGAIPRELVEGTLFGHERGAFTGASQQQKGLFEEADGGTVFLDEIAELPAPAQAALLRVLETKRLTRVGSAKEIAVDVRIIAATHRDLEAMCAEGTFRQDLYYRMNTMTLTIPPLRDRADEIEPLALRFLRQANEQNHGEVRGIEPMALARLKDYSWPGNVRELRNAIERAVVIARGEVIREHDLPARVRAADGPASRRSPEASFDEHEDTADPVGEVFERVTEPLDGSRKARTTLAPDEPRAKSGPVSSGEGGDLRAKLQRYEVELILEALRQTRWNQTEAAKVLGMPLRTLVHKIKALGIKRLDR